MRLPLAFHCANLRFGNLRFLLLVLIAGPAYAQSASVAARYWIVFADRPADAPTVEATAHALERRALRGSPQQPARPDAGVSPRYIAALRAAGIEPRAESRWLNAVSAALTPADVARVRALPFVREVRSVARYERAEIAAAPALPLAVETRGGLDYGASAFQLGFVNADATLDAGYSGANIVLGFLDTLFDFAHPAMALIPADGRLLGVQDFTGQSQDNYHGLATSSVAGGFAGGELIGPAYGANFLAATTEYAPTETHAEEDYFVAGLEWLEANGVDVVSVSLGYSTFDEGEGDYTYADMDGDTTPFTRAVDRAASLGVVVVVSAGNLGDDDWRIISAPADADSVITVGAARADSTVAAFSSVGPTFDGRIKPDVAALGVQVHLAGSAGDYYNGNGTSFSAPMVAGIAAQLLEANASLTPMQVREAFRQTASQSGAPDTLLGWGIVDAEAALAEAIELGTEEPAPVGALAVYPSVLAAGAALTIAFDAEGGAHVEAVLFDVLGRRVATLADRTAQAGPNRLRLTVPPLAPGAYVLRLVEGERSESRRVTVVR